MSAAFPPRAFEEFRIVRALGAGAMGEVFLAEDELLGRQVAIKFVRNADRPEARARFQLEARALARLAHPNVVTVHRVGAVLGRPFLVSEWVRGESLDHARKPLPREQVLHISVQLARALAAVHRVGVLHRDLKPANVLLAESGEVKLVDFGASATDGGEPDVVNAASDTPPGGSLAETQPLPNAPATTSQPAAALQVGTPLYAAPELLSGAQASAKTDIYSYGAVIYELCAGRPPHRASSLDELRALASAGRVEPLRDVATPLADLIHRCLSPDPRDRPARAEALLDVLEPMLLVGTAATGEPYRGLSVFGPEHAALFFGREREAQAVAERLRAATFVLVAGDSGVGKSSLCRAGVLPLVQAAKDRRWRVAELTPGARPIEAFAAAIAPWLSSSERDVASALRAEPEAIAARARMVLHDEGRLLYVDALEELCALASGEDVELCARFLGALAVRSSAFRLLATARSDFLTRLSALPGLGPEVEGALYLLRPLTDEGLRQAIEGPARALGFRFEPEALVDELVAVARPGALPLVQFALAELWRRRDPQRKVITREALAGIGGVTGALARHADSAIAAMPAAQRAAAEQILRRLVTAEGTRRRRARTDLPSGDDASGALSRLTAARLVVARDPPDGKGEPAYELAHEALIGGWDQLRAWIGRDAEKRALAQRVERAAEEWQRLGGAAEGLWSRRQLRDVEGEELPDLGPRELGFLAASRRRARRSKVATAAVAIALPLLVSAAIFGARLRAQAERREQAAAKLATADASLIRAKTIDATEQRLARDAFALFDRGDAAAELLWSRARTARADLEKELAAARAALDAAWLLSPSQDVQHRLAAVIAFRLERERGHPLSRERRSLLDQLPAKERARFEQPARVSLQTEPRGLPAALRPLDPPGEPHPLGEAEREVRAGSYVVEVGDHTRLPVLLRHGELRRLAVDVPPEIRDGFIHVPAGPFLTGFDGDEDVRRGFFNTAPLHERDGRPFLVARHEVTFAEWLDWLRALPPDERARRMPRAESMRNKLALTQLPDGRFHLRIQPAAAAYDAGEGEPIRYPGRKRNAEQDWRRFPVSGISFEDARAFAQFRGARLCGEDEWERAARGADGRAFPSGDALADANIDATYGREPLSFGPDAVGLHAASDSPVGAADMAGNVWDMTVAQDGSPRLRGGSWYQGTLTSRSANREAYEPSARDLLIGFRLCADPASRNRLAR